MRAYYLKILELREGAGQKEIKTAYRRLSKKYHPDLNPSEDAVEKFIEIDRAYDYLLNNDREPIVIKDRRDPYEEWKLRVRRNKWEKEQQRIQLIEKILKNFNVIWYFLAILNVLLLLDYLLPKQLCPQEIVRLTYAGASAREYRYDDVTFTNYYMRFSKKKFDWENPDYRFTVKVTRIFSAPVGVQVHDDSGLTELRPTVGIYAFWIFLIPLVLLLFIIYRFAPMTTDNRLTLTIFVIVPMILQWYVIATYS